MYHYSFILFLFSLLIIVGCKSEMPQTEESPVARVFDKNLYISDFQDLITSQMSEEDSIALVQAYSRKWVRDELLFQQASKAIASDKEINRLVADYRASLIINKYEASFLQKNLDTTFTQEILQKHYDENKDQFILKSNAIQCYYMRLPQNAPNIDQVKKWWRSAAAEDTDALEQYAMQYEFDYFLNPNKWLRKEELATKLPEDALKEQKLRSKQKDYTFKDDFYIYLLKVNKIVPEGDPAPLDFATSDIKKILLKKRKLETLKSLASEMYQRELSKKNVEFF